MVGLSSHTTNGKPSSRHHQPSALAADQDKGHTTHLRAVLECNLLGVAATQLVRISLSSSLQELLDKAKAGSEAQLTRILQLSMPQQDNAEVQLKVVACELGMQVYDSLRYVALDLQDWGNESISEVLGSTSEQQACFRITYSGQPAHVLTSDCFTTPSSGLPLVQVDAGNWAVQPQAVPWDIATTPEGSGMQKAARGRLQNQGSATAGMLNVNSNVVQTQQHGRGANVAADGMNMLGMLSAPAAATQFRRQPTVQPVKFLLCMPNANVMPMFEPSNVPFQGFATPFVGNGMPYQQRHTPEPIQAHNGDAQGQPVASNNVADGMRSNLGAVQQATALGLMVTDQAGELQLPGVTVSKPRDPRIATTSSHHQRQGSSRPDSQQITANDCGENQLATQAASQARVAAINDAQNGQTQSLAVEGISPATTLVSQPNTQVQQHQSETGSRKKRKRKAADEAEHVDAGKEQHQGGQVPTASASSNGAWEAVGALTRQLTGEAAALLAQQATAATARQDKQPTQPSTIEQTQPASQHTQLANGSTEEQPQLQQLLSSVVQLIVQVWTKEVEARPVVKITDYCLCNKASEHNIIPELDPKGVHILYGEKQGYYDHASQQVVCFCNTCCEYAIRHWLREQSPTAPMTAQIKLLKQLHKRMSKEIKHGNHANTSKLGKESSQMTTLPGDTEQMHAPAASSVQTIIQLLPRGSCQLWGHHAGMDRKATGWSKEFKVSYLVKDERTSTIREWFKHTGNTVPTKKKGTAASAFSHDGHTIDHGPNQTLGMATMEGLKAHYDKAVHATQSTGSPATSAQHVSQPSMSAQADAAPPTSIQQKAASALDIGQGDASRDSQQPAASKQTDMQQVAATQPAADGALQQGLPDADGWHTKQNKKKKAGEPTADPAACLINHNDNETAGTGAQADNDMVHDSYHTLQGEEEHHDNGAAQQSLSKAELKALKKKKRKKKKKTEKPDTQEEEEEPKELELVETPVDEGGMGEQPEVEEDKLNELRELVASGQQLTKRQKKQLKHMESAHGDARLDLQKEHEGREDMQNGQIEEAPPHPQQKSGKRKRDHDEDDVVAIQTQQEEGAGQLHVEPPPNKKQKKANGKLGTAHGSGDEFAEQQEEVQGSQQGDVGEQPDAGKHTQEELDLQAASDGVQTGDNTGQLENTGSGDGFSQQDGQEREHNQSMVEGQHSKDGSDSRGETSTSSSASDTSGSTDNSTSTSESTSSDSKSSDSSSSSSSSDSDTSSSTDSSSSESSSNSSSNGGSSSSDKQSSKSSKGGSKSETKSDSDSGTSQGVDSGSEKEKSESDGEDEHMLDAQPSQALQEFIQQHQGRGQSLEALLRAQMGISHAPDEDEVEDQLPLSTQDANNIAGAEQNNGKKRTKKAATKQTAEDGHPTADSQSPIDGITMNTSEPLPKNLVPLRQKLKQHLREYISALRVKAGKPALLSTMRFNADEKPTWWPAGVDYTLAGMNSGGRQETELMYNELRKAINQLRDAAGVNEPA